MRTTLTLDDDVAARLHAEARRSARPFKVVVNETLRTGLAQRRASIRSDAFRVESVDLGARQPGAELDSIALALDRIEGPLHR